MGEGRLSEVDAIVETVLAEARRARDLEGVNVLVTAGPTYEAIDPVRFIGNASSGKTGYAIAEEAARRGATVTLVSGPTSLPDPFGVGTVRVKTALEMHAAVVDAYEASDVVVATAAVSDLRPAQAMAGKIKKDDAPDSIALVRTPDILAELGQSKGQRVLVGFAAETSDVLEHARTKRAEKNLDLVVANDVSVAGLGFASDENRVTFVWADREEALPRQSKRAIARALWDAVGEGARAAAVETTRTEGLGTGRHRWTSKGVLRSSRHTWEKRTSTTTARSTRRSSSRRGSRGARARQ